MKNNIEILREIQQNYDLLKHSKEALKDRSSLEKLKNMKREFEEEKINYKILCEKLDEIAKKYELIDEKIKVYNKEVKEKKELLYNKCGSNFKLIEKLQKEIEIYEKDIKHKENEQFELLECEEKFKGKIQELKKKLINLKKNFSQIKENAHQKKLQLENDYKKALEAISRLEKEVPQSLIQKFYDIQESKTNPIAELENGVCSGCKIAVSIMTINELKLNKKIVTCDNCGRILYII